MIQEMRLINPIFTVLLTFPHIGHLTRANVDISLEEEPSEGDMLSWIIMVRFQKMERVSCRRRSVSSGSRRRRDRNFGPRDRNSYASHAVGTLTVVHRAANHKHSTK